MGGCGEVNDASETGGVWAFAGNKKANIKKGPQDNAIANLKQLLMPMRTLRAGKTKRPKNSRPGLVPSALNQTKENMKRTYSELRTDLSTYPTH